MLQRFASLAMRLYWLSSPTSFRRNVSYGNAEHHPLLAYELGIKPTHRLSLSLSKYIANHFSFKAGLQRRVESGRMLCVINLRRHSRVPLK